MWPKAAVFIAGFLITTVGIAITLQQWEAIVLVFKACIGPVLAVSGLVVLFASTLKQKND